MQGEAEGILCLGQSWPAQFRTLFGDHKRYEEAYFSSYKVTLVVGGHMYERMNLAAMSHVGCSFSVCLPCAAQLLARSCVPLNALHGCQSCKIHPIPLLSIRCDTTCICTMISLTAKHTSTCCSRQTLRHAVGWQGFYFTGDGAKRSKDGYITITGRVDDVINVSGHRVGTAEVESALASHGACVEAAVVG